MLTYHRSATESLPPRDRDNALTYRMLNTPYKVNALPSETDNIMYQQDTPYVDVWQRHVMYAGYNDPNYTDLFSQASVDWMSLQISLRLRGVHPEGKNIIVPDSTILSVADSVYQNTFLTLELLQEMTVLHIVEAVKNDFELTQQNDKLSIWQTLYSMDTGLQRISQVDSHINDRRGTHYYHWNY
jgi:hypothetical protein